MILAIDTETFLGINYDEAVSIIKSLGGNVKMLVTSPREEEAIKMGGNEPKPPLQPRREEPSGGAGASKPAPAAAKAAEPSPAKPKTEEKPKPKEEDTKVELTKDASGLGFSIVGGSDTPLVLQYLMFHHSKTMTFLFQGGVLIQEIYKGGPAEKSGKLKVGDKIIKLNDVDFTKVTHTEAMEAIRGGSDKVRN